MITEICGIFINLVNHIKNKYYPHTKEENQFKIILSEFELKI